MENFKIFYLRNKMIEVINYLKELMNIDIMFNELKRNLIKILIKKVIDM